MEHDGKIVSCDSSDFSRVLSSEGESMSRRYGKYTFEHNENNNNNKITLNTQVSTYILANILLFLTEAITAYVASLGSPFNEKPRHAIKYVFIVHYIMFLIEVACLLLLTFILLFDNLTGALDTELLCSRSLSNGKFTTYFILLCVMWRLMSVIIRLLCHTCCGNMSGTEQWTSQRYTQCWRWLLCGDKDHEKDEKADLYKQLGKMCAFFFVDDELKLLPTDIIAGLALIREKQLDRKRLLRERKEEKEEDTKDLGETLKNAHEIFPFALSAYGWLVRVTCSIVSFHYITTLEKKQKTGTSLRKSLCGHKLLWWNRVPDCKC